MAKKNISRRRFIKGVAEGTVGAAALGVLSSCKTVNDTVCRVDNGAPGLDIRYIPGTYTSEQKTGFASVQISCTFSETAITDVDYKVIETSDSDFFPMYADDSKAYCRRIVDTGSTIGVDGISGATICSTAIKDGVNNCMAQALGIDLAAKNKEANEKTAELNPQDYDYTGNSITDFSKSEFFTDWKFGKHTLNCRLVKSAAGSAYLPGTTDEEIISEYSTWAQNGVKLVWVEDFVNMHPRYPAAYKAATRENSCLKEIASAIHKAGSICGYQLSLMGTKFSGFDPAKAPKFASAKAADLTVKEIHEVQEAFADAAKFLKKQGFDAVEINAAGNNIGQAFLSRNRNERTDQYGCQNFENRTRFIREMIAAIHKECGDDFPVQVLINGIEENDKLIGQSAKMTTVEENIEMAKAFEAAGAASLHVRIGPFGMHVAEFAPDLYFTGRGINGTTSYGTAFDFSKHFQGKLIANHSGCGLMLDVAKEIKSAVSIPVGTVTYMDPAHAPDFFEQALLDKKVDFMLMTRPLQADPEYMKKLKENRVDEIAPCTRCMHCHYDYNEQGELYEHCRVNPIHMRAFHEQMPEGRDLLPAKRRKKVMVVGGGPAGMEAARIAALRGYTVTLYEKSGSLGGLLAFASAVKGPHENLDELRNYMIRQQEVTGVKVVTGTEVTADLVASEAPDVVILAVGGKRKKLGISASAGTDIISIEDVLGAKTGDNVTVVGASAQAVDTALYLMAQGKNVTILSEESSEAMGKGQSSWVKTFTNPMIYAKGVHVWPNARVISLGAGQLTFTSETGVDMTIACDTVVEAMDMLKNTDLSDSLKNRKLYSIGDCVRPFNIAEAIAAGNLTARNI